LGLALTSILTTPAFCASAHEVIDYGPVKAVIAKRLEHITPALEPTNYDTLLRGHLLAEKMILKYSTFIDEAALLPAEKANARLIELKPELDKDREALYYDHRYRLGGS